MSRNIFDKLLLSICVFVTGLALCSLSIYLWKNAIRIMMSKNGCHCGEVQP